jgi:hypothetical protein
VNEVTHPDLPGRVFGSEKNMLKALRKKRARQDRKERQRLERKWQKAIGGVKIVSGGAPGLGKRR